MGLQRGWIENLVCAIFFVASLTIYARTSYNSVPGGDSPELIITAYSLGVAHPPGYPTWTLIGHLFSKLQLLLPEKSVVWCVGVSSGFSSALAGVVMLKTISLLTGGGWLCGLLVAGFFSFSPLVWVYSTQAEVFPLNNLLIALLLYATASWELIWDRYAASASSQIDPKLNTKKKSPPASSEDEGAVLRATYLSAFLCGVGMTNQHTFVVFMLPIVLVILLRGLRLFFCRPQIPLLIGLAFAAGMLPYLYMPLTQLAAFRPYSWGDTTSLSGFLTHLLRREYGTFQLHTSFAAGSLLQRLACFAADFSASTLHLGIPLALLGACSLAARKPTTGAATAAAMALYLLGFLYLCNMPVDNGLLRGVLARFFLQPSLLAHVWAGVGLHEALRYLRARAGARAQQGPLSGAVLRAVLVGLVVAMLAARVAHHYAEFDRSETDVIQDIMLRYLSKVPQGAIFLVTGDMNINPMQYLQLVEGHRPDIDILSVEHLTFAWWDAYRAFYPRVYFPPTLSSRGRPFPLHQFAEGNAGRDIMHIGESPRFKKPGALGDYALSETGKLKRVLKKAEDYGTVERAFQTFNLLPFNTRLASLDFAAFAEDSWEYAAIKGYQNAHLATLNALATPLRGVDLAKTPMSTREKLATLALTVIKVAETFFPRLHDTVVSEKLTILLELASAKQYYFSHLHSQQKPQVLEACRSMLATLDLFLTFPESTENSNYARVLNLRERYLANEKALLLNNK